MCQVGDRWKGAGRHIHLTYHLIRTHFIILLWMGGSCQVPHVQDEYQHWGTHWGRCHALEGIRLLIEQESITRDICSGLWVDLWTVDKFTGNRTWLWLCRSWTFCSEELKGTRTNTAERTGARWGCWRGSENLQLQPVLTREAECVLCFIVRVF